MSQDNLQGYGYVADNDESLQSKQGGKFGGNFGVAYITQFEYKENVAKEGNPEREAIEVVIKVRDREQKVWFSPVNKVFGKDSQELKPGDEGYAEGFNAQMVQQNATVIHYLKALGVSEDSIKNALSGNITSFKEYAQKIISLLPTGFDKRPLDLFMEFQWAFGKKADGTLNDKTYPQVPKNMKGGYFIVPAQPGNWEEKRGEDGSLFYVNAEGTEHPFKRDESFMSGNKGTQQNLGGTSDDSDFSNPMAQGEAQSSGW